MRRLARSGVAVSIAAAAQFLIAPRAFAEAQVPFAAAASSPPADLLGPRSPPGAPRVTLQVDEPNARLQMRGLHGWYNVCAVPCRLVLDPTQLYRVGSGTTRASKPFMLPNESRDVVVEAQAGSSAAHWAGLGMTLWGGALSILGFVFYSGGFAGTREPQGHRNGIVALSIGLALEAVGIPLLLSHTSVQVN